MLCDLKKTYDKYLERQLIPNVLKKYKNDSDKLLEYHFKIDDRKFNYHRAKEFKGFTTIVRLREDGEHKCLSDKIVDVQNKIKHIFNTKCVHFLAQKSFHMTICDIEPGKDFNKSIIEIDSNLFYKRYIQIYEAFDALINDNVNVIKASIYGVGSEATELLINFDKKNLYNVLKMERRIKETTHNDLRSFCGHIAFSYYNKNVFAEINKNGIRILEKIGKEIKTCLRDINNTIFTFNNIEYCYFYDMNNYIPVLELDILQKKINNPNKLFSHSDLIDFITEKYEHKDCRKF